MPASGGVFTHNGGKGVKLELDLAVGATSAIESDDKGKMGEIAQKVQDLNARLLDIKREQVFQRVSSQLLEVSQRFLDATLPPVRDA